MGGITSIGGSGSPLDARQTSAPYTVLLIGGILIGLFFVCWILLKILKKYKQSPAYIEKQKQRTTTIKDVQALAEKIDLTKPEASLLFSICRRESAQNILYTWTDQGVIDTLFKSEFKRMKQKRVSDDDIFELFKLRSKIEKVLSIKKAIPTSHNIPAKSEVFLPTEDRGQFTFKVVKNEKESMTLEVPKNIEGTEYYPKPLSKIMMKYISPDQIKYLFSPRVIRFQTSPDQKHLMLIQHANTVSMQSRRQYKRANVGGNCAFYGVNQTEEKNGDFTYSPKETKYEGQFVDISAGGCLIKTKLPIKRDQKIWLEIQLPGYEKIEVCGLIVGVKRNIETGIQSLHISFLNISGKDRNQIFSYVYDYA